MSKIGRKRKSFSGSPTTDNMVAALKSQGTEAFTDTIDMAKITTDPDNYRPKKITQAITEFLSKEDDITAKYKKELSELWSLESAGLDDIAEFVARYVIAMPEDQQQGGTTVKEYVNDLVILASDIRTEGLTQAITVYRHGHGFKLIIGERRYYCQYHSNAVLD